MTRKLPTYNDDEVKAFHPIVESCAKKALENLGLDKEYEVTHHRSFSKLPVDFSIDGRGDKKVYLLIEVKRTKSAVQSTRSRHQAMSYRQEADPVCATPYYALTNIENTDLFRYDKNKPRVSSQIIKGSPFQCGEFGSSSVKEFLEMYVDHLCEIITIALNDTGEYDPSLDLLHSSLENKTKNHDNWHKQLMPFSFEYIRGAANNFTQLQQKITANGWRSADSYASSPNRISQRGSEIDFAHIFSAPNPAASSFDPGLLSSAYKNGQIRADGDDVSEIVYELLAPQEKGVVETDHELAGLLATLARVELGRKLKPTEMITDPAAGSGRLLTAAVSGVFPEAKPAMLWANEILPHFSEALSLRLGLQFGDQISSTNHPKITVGDIASLKKSDFKDTKVILLNPPYVSGVSAKTRKASICQAIASVSGKQSKTNAGQIGLEAPFLELIVNLVPDDTIIAAIMPFAMLTRKSDEICRYRKFLLEDFGLKMICTYPREGLFKGVTKRTCIFVGKKGSKNNAVKWVSIDAAIERIDPSDLMPSLGVGRLFSAMNLTNKDLTGSIKFGWVSPVKKASQEWIKMTLNRNNSIALSDFSEVKRGTSGNNGSAKLACIPFDNTMLINMIPASERLLGINNADGIPKFLDASNAPCVSPKVDKVSMPAYLNPLINAYIKQKAKQKKTGKQSVAPITPAKVLTSIRKNVQVFPKWSVLIPRNIRKHGGISVTCDLFNVSTNFGVVKCKSKKEAIVLASWLISIFGQMQMELLCNDQEGARKLEMKEVRNIALPINLQKITEKYHSDLISAYNSSDPIDYDYIQIRSVDEVWAKIMCEVASSSKQISVDSMLNDALNHIQNLVDERDP